MLLNAPDALDPIHWAARVTKPPPLEQRQALLVSNVDESALQPLVMAALFRHGIAAGG